METTTLGKRIWKNRLAYLFISPTIIGLMVFNFYPFFIAVTKSFYRWSGSFSKTYGINEFVGLQNYIDLFNDKVFLNSWLNLFFFIITGIVVNIVFPFLNAELIYAIKDGGKRYFYRVMFIVPLVIPAMVIFLLWKFIYNPQFGVVNRVLQAFDSEAFVAVLGNVDTVKWGIRFMGFPWVGGILLLIYLAGLSSINPSVIEAAIIDGANKWNQIRYIHIPLLMGQFKLVIIMTIISEVQDFVKIMVVTDGGPGFASVVPGLYMYKQAFGQNAYGYANAIGVTLLVFILTLSLISNKLMKSKRTD